MPNQRCKCGSMFTAQKEGRGVSSLFVCKICKDWPNCTELAGQPPTTPDEDWPKCGGCGAVLEMGVCPYCYSENP